MEQSKRVGRRWPGRVVRVFLVIFLLYIAPVGFAFGVYYFGEGRTSSWWDLRTDSSQQAPDPAMTDDGIIQVYAARAVRWRGAVGVHTWIATKKSNEDFYTRLEVMGYALRWGGQAVQIRNGQPDRYWYGSRPQLLREIRGDEVVDELIVKLHKAAASYQYSKTYRIWPGPNSNTFVAHLGRQIPELNLELPATAVGKDYLPDSGMIAKTPSGRGLQISIAGALGLVVGLEEGLEINLLGLTAGIDFSPLAIKLPGLGRIGFDDLERIEIR